MGVRENQKKLLILNFVISTFLLFFVFLISLVLGTEKINLTNALSNSLQQNFDRIILFKLRLPRSLLAAFSGALLAGSGAIFQMFFRNELAEPGIIGISSAATLGAVLSSSFGILSGTSGYFLFRFISPISFFAFIGALFAGFLIVLIGYKSSSSNSSVVILLCGTALGTFYSSISSIFIMVKSRDLHSLYSWILGSFNGRGWKEFQFILLPSLASIIIMFIILPQLDLLSGGETSAKSLGISINKLRTLVLISASLAVSSSVCAGGTISFVGLIAPHIVRRLSSSKSKILIPLSMIYGAILLLAADTLARTVISPSEIPTGVITSILGVPFFLSLFLSKR